MPSVRDESKDSASLYEVRLTRAANKDLKQLRSHANTIAKALGQLRTDPVAGYQLQGSLAGIRSLEFTFKGSGAGRAAYVILAEHKVCLVFITGSHGGFYERAERHAAALGLVETGIGAEICASHPTEFVTVLPADSTPGSGSLIRRTPKLIN
jgi:hypothetical protein